MHNMGNRKRRREKREESQRVGETSMSHISLEFPAEKPHCTAAVIRVENKGRRQAGREQEQDTDTDSEDAEDIVSTF